MQVTKYFGTILVSALVFFGTAVAAAPSAHISPCLPEGDFQMLPAGMDVDSANRVLCWMKHQVHAPLGLPPPPVFVGPLQLNKYSVFMFPTPEAPDDVFSIEIAPSAGLLLFISPDCHDRPQSPCP
jgi:hypothetical protein